MFRLRGRLLSLRPKGPDLGNANVGSVFSVLVLAEVVMLGSFCFFICV